MQDYSKFQLACVRDDRDDRDFRKFSAAPPVELPETCNVPAQPPIRNQLQTSACTGFAAAWMWSQLLLSRGMLEPGLNLSAKFAWFWARFMDGNELQDTGAQIRNVMKGLSEYGCPPVDEWPDTAEYDIEPSASSKVWGAALRLPGSTYERLDSVRAIKYAVAIEQQSAVIGLPIYSAWFDAPLRNNGIVPARQHLGTLEGWHALVVAGYTKERLILANSWGDYGAHGYVFVPWEYLQYEEGGGFPGWDAWTVGFSDIMDAPGPNMMLL